MDQEARSSERRSPFEPEMVRIPAGPFLMGSPKRDKRREDAEPDQFELNLDYEYAIGKFPITVGQFRTFIEAGGYREQRFWTNVGWQLSNERTQPDHWTDKDWVGDDNLPVVGISWYEASAYTRWLAEATTRDYRLPTEAGWEKAARGGLQLPDGRGGWHKNPYPARLWPWGDEQPDESRLNFNSAVKHTTPVGKYPQGASPYDVLDMAGNVWEWCLSRWAIPYVFPENIDSEGDSNRVVRGGSWFNNDNQARCSHRLKLHPNLRFDHDVGFRVSLNAAP